MEKKNTGLIVITVILSILVLGLGGFIVYDKCLRNKNDDKPITNNNKDDTNDVLYKYSLSNRKYVQQSADNNCLLTMVDTNGGAYILQWGPTEHIDKEILDNLDKALSPYVKTPLKASDDSFEDENTLNAYKIQGDDFLASYFVHSKNDNNEYCILIRKDGTLSYFSTYDIYYKGEFNLKNIDNVKNVISIGDNQYTGMPFAITFDGKKIALNDYIK